ncbi:MAG: OmpH family outer membrane protein [Bacteroidales bacterium]|jgi:outer membrane protein|nr:OmpH family outer membrane protein [Bacteroidales bacterium]
MKKIALIAAAALLTLSASAQTLKFAHVNFSELVQLMPEADQARAAIAASTKEAEETYQSMVEEYQAKANAYQQKASTWTAAIKESKEKELSDIGNRIQEFQQNIQAELQQQQSQLMAPIQEKAMKAVEALAKEGGYIYVFERNQLLFVDEKQSTDLTPAARKALGIPEGRTLESLQAELQAQAQAQQQQ